MVKLAALSLVISTAAAILTWSTAKCREMLLKQRANAHLRPRARPYGHRLHKSLTSR